MTDCTNPDCAEHKHPLGVMAQALLDRDATDKLTPSTQLALRHLRDTTWRPLREAPASSTSCKRAIVIRAHSEVEECVVHHEVWPCSQLPPIDLTRIGQGTGLVSPPAAL